MHEKKLGQIAAQVCRHTGESAIVARKSHLWLFIFEELRECFGTCGGFSLTLLWSVAGVLASLCLGRGFRFRHGWHIALNTRHCDSLAGCRRRWFRANWSGRLRRSGRCCGLVRYCTYRSGPPRGYSGIGTRQRRLLSERRGAAVTDASLPHPFREAGAPKDRV